MTNPHNRTAIAMRGDDSVAVGDTLVFRSGVDRAAGGKEWQCCEGTVLLSFENGQKASGIVSYWCDVPRGIRFWVTSVRGHREGGFCATVQPALSE